MASAIPSVDGSRQSKFVQEAQSTAIASAPSAPLSAAPEDQQAPIAAALPTRDAAPFGATPSNPDPNHPAGQIEVGTSTIKWESSNDGDSATAEVRNQDGELQAVVTKNNTAGNVTVVPVDPAGKEGPASIFKLDKIKNDLVPGGEGRTPIRVSGDLETTRQDPRSPDFIYDYYDPPATARIHLLDGIANPPQATENAAGVDHEFFEAGGVQIELGAESDSDGISVTVEQGIYKTNERADGTRYLDTTAFRMSDAAVDPRRIQFSDTFGFPIDATPGLGTEADPTTPPEKADTFAWYNPTTWTDNSNSRWYVPTSWGWFDGQ